MDTNGVITISSADWSQHPKMEKTDSIPEIILYWKHSTVSLPKTFVWRVLIHLGVSVLNPGPGSIYHSGPFKCVTRKANFLAGSVCASCASAIKPCRGLQPPCHSVGDYGEGFS